MSAGCAVIPPAVSRAAVAEVRLGAADVAALLGCSTSTARARLARWAGEGHPVERERSPRGEPRYAIARADLAAIIPELDDDG